MREFDFTGEEMCPEVDGTEYDYLQEEVSFDNNHPCPACGGEGCRFCNDGEVSESLAEKLNEILETTKTLSLESLEREYEEWVNRKL